MDRPDLKRSLIVSATPARVAWRQSVDNKWRRFHSLLTISVHGGVLFAGQGVPQGDGGRERYDAGRLHEGPGAVGV